MERQLMDLRQTNVQNNTAMCRHIARPDADGTNNSIPMSMRVTKHHTIPKLGWWVITVIIADAQT